MVFGRRLANLCVMKSYGFVLLLSVLLGVAAPVTAQPASVSKDQAKHLIETLQNEAARTKLIEELRTLVAVQEATEEQGFSMADFVAELSDRLDSLGEAFLEAAPVIFDVPRIVSWLEAQYGDPGARARWTDLGTKLAAIFAGALLAEWTTYALLARPRRSLVGKTSDRLALRLLLILAHTVVDTLPILVFAIVASGVAAVTHPPVIAAMVATIFVESYLAARIVTVAARRLLLTNSTHGLVAGLEERTRADLFAWCRRFVCWSAWGYAAILSSWWLGVPGGIQALLLNGVVFVLSLLSVVFVLQNRHRVAEWLRGSSTPATAGAPSSGWLLLRRWVADIWHILAIAYIIGLFGVYAFHIRGGFPFVLRATGISVSALLAARILASLARNAVHRGFGAGGAFGARHPIPEARAKFYLPMLAAVAAVLAHVLAFLVVLQAWNIPAFAWFSTPSGRQLSAQFLTVSAVIVTAIAIWEAFSVAIERYLGAVDTRGSLVARSARIRTLLPLMHTAVTILVFVMAGLIVLSELGINIAPLLAGAGVAGLAIGFGSQALVKDIITGLFILLEDTLAVGDVVDLGKGHSGVVETISIRTIRLRDVAGTLHAIPFSEVTTVSNMTKGYSYFVANVAVSYREDIDRVIAVMREVAEGLATDPACRPYILEPLEVLGLDKMMETGVVVQARLKTVPRKQWMVGREFNRRLKNAFDRLGIEMPYLVKPNYLASQEPEEAGGGAGSA